MRSLPPSDTRPRVETYREEGWGRLSRNHARRGEPRGRGGEYRIARSRRAVTCASGHWQLTLHKRNEDGENTADGVGKRGFRGTPGVATGAKPKACLGKGATYTNTAWLCVTRLQPPGVAQFRRVRCGVPSYLRTAVSQQKSESGFEIGAPNLVSTDVFRALRMPEPPKLKKGAGEQFYLRFHSQLDSWENRLCRCVDKAGCRPHTNLVEMQSAPTKVRKNNPYQNIDTVTRKLPQNVNGLQNHVYN